MTVESDVYKLIIAQPKMDDMGKYTIDIGGVTSSAYLTVEGKVLADKDAVTLELNDFVFEISEPDVVYAFIRNLAKKAEGYLHRDHDLECQVNNYKAPISWYKGDQKIEEGTDKYEITKDMTGVCRLIIKDPVKADSGDFSCRVDGQTAKTACHLKFVRKQLFNSIASLDN